MTYILSNFPAEESETQIEKSESEAQIEVRGGI
jgi:hypothetical protein